MRLKEEQRSLQNVFRIPKASKPARTTPANQSSADPAKDQKFRPRKTHRKSRKGCQNCKSRHVRCDETAGGCLRCKNHGVECDYAQLADDSSLQSTHTLLDRSGNSGKSSSNHSQVSTPAASASKLTELSSFNEIVPRHISTSPVPYIPYSKGHAILDPQAVLRHFHAMTAATCGSPTSQAVYRSSVTPVAIQTPYLMYALLGLTTAHLRHLMGKGVTATRTKLKVAECYYWAEAFNGFRRELAGSDDDQGVIATRRSNITRSNMDQLLSTLMLVSMHQFSYRDYDHTEADPAEKSFIWMESRTQRDAALKWLGVEAGFKGLIGAMAPWLYQSFWLPIMRRVEVAGEVDLTSWISSQTLDQTEQKLIAICGISATSTSSNPYYVNLETLLWCRRLRPIGPEHFNQMIAFVGRTNPEFRALVLERDTAALVVLLYWLQLMNDVGQWWIVERCMAEIRAIVAFLYQRDVLGRHDKELLSLLQPLAATVGLRLSFAAI